MTTYAMRQQERTWDAAKSKIVAWTATEENILAEMLAQGMTHSDIAVELGRTYAGVANKVYKMRKAGWLE